MSSSTCGRDDLKCRFEKLAQKITAMDPTEITIPQQFLTVYTPTQVKELIFGNALHGPIREVIEPVSADEQCHRAGVDFISGKTTCWLCGCRIEEGDDKACEHIIPALRAIMFSGMITTRKINERIDAAGTEREFLNKVTNNNYLWAHDNCNGSGAKGGMVLFKYNDGMFVVDNEKCGELESKITSLKKPTRYSCYKTPPIDSIYKNLVRVIEERLEPINYEFNQFISYIPETNRPNALRYYAQYTMEIIKLYASAESLELLLTPEQRAQRAALAEEQRVQQETARSAEEAEELRIQQETARAAEQAYEKFLGIISTMRVKEEKTKGIGSKFNSIDDINIDLQTRLACGQFLEQSFKSSRPVKLSSFINLISDNVSQQIRIVLEALWGDLKGNITVIESLISLMLITLIFQEGAQRGLQIRTEGIISGNRSIISDITDLKCNAIVDLYLNILRQFETGTKLSEADPMKSPLFQKIFSVLSPTVGITYEGCNEIITQRITEERKNFERIPFATPESYTIAQLKKGEHIEGTLGSYNSYGSMRSPRANKQINIPETSYEVSTEEDELEKRATEIQEQEQRQRKLEEDLKAAEVEKIERNIQEQRQRQIEEDFKAAEVEKEERKIQEQRQRIQQEQFITEGRRATNSDLGIVESQSANAVSFNKNRGIRASKNRNIGYDILYNLPPKGPNKPWRGGKKSKKIKNTKKIIKIRNTKKIIKVKNTRKIRKVRNTRNIRKVRNTKKV